MDLQQLRAFVAIAEAGGVTRAAERLHLSQPAVSRQLQMLESELGVSVFERAGRRLRITADGEELLRRVRLILAETDSLRDRARALQAGDTGVLKIGATPPMIETVLSGFLQGYRRRHPDVEVHIIEDGGSSLAERLDRGDVHLAYVPAGNDRHAGRLLYPIHVVAAVPASSELARHRVLDIASLAGKQLLALRRGFGSREWFEAACEAASVRPITLLESGSHNVILGLAGAGYGIGILPSAIPKPASGVRIVPLMHRRVPIGKWTMLAWDRRRFLPPYARQFADELVAYAQKNYPGRDLVRRAPSIRRPPVTRTDVE